MSALSEPQRRVLDFLAAVKSATCGDLREAGVPTHSINALMRRDLVRVEARWPPPEVYRITSKGRRRLEPVEEGI